MKVYTKTGDDGTTSLIGGQRVSKADAQVEAYGQLDELNSAIGYFYSLYGNALSEEYRALLLQIQRDLFKIGTLLSFDFHSSKPFTYSFIEEKDIDRLEQEIDAMQTVLPALRGFVLPGGCAAAAYVHQLRCVCRRCERRVMALYERWAAEVTRGVSYASGFVLALRYINRLSDFFFVMARFLNKEQGTEETLV
ncbi:MAG: cob(I)yrinic acid a,c-diamide adenosyltransferase [Bacteroidales bacterium]|nr:cob(I)yrinic acid a,c-diamide adenosyltransferase [Bacteroidales bacterium]MDE7102862.1 cob(I)yrinic acid a,c-diamide adenosyltransferase [Bacteroidales bacterium]